MINTDDCLLWARSTDYKDYGHISVKRNNKWTTTVVHRALYEAKYGELPRDLVLDHLCHTPRCINLEHLEPVTNQVNIKRGIFKKAAATHCIQGHKYTIENTMRQSKSNTRFCRECHRLSSKRQYLKRKSIQTL